MAIELTPTPEAVLVEGAVGCGKTTRLVERAAALLEGGAAPSDLLVLAATPDAARMLAARLEAACGAAVEATCVREVALGLLATEGGRAFSDRAGRLVTPVEMGFIMEDMKTCGLKNRRLKEMLKFFYRSWTELVEDADGNADWLLAGEEADVHGLLKGILDFTGGILEPELSALAARYLLADGEALAGAQRAHVLVDDYQMLSRASQHVANLLARDSIAVAADPAAVVEVFDSYPYGEGVGEFTQANADCERIVLTESHACGAAAHAASRLREDAAPGAPEITGVGDAPATDSFTARESADPAAEVAAVAEAVEAALGAGCAPEDVYVLTFHPAWMRQVLRALAARDIAAAAPVEGRLSVGDYRDLDRCAPARLLAALDLAADPANALAWRSWCGFGDYLANSAAFADMRAGAAAEGAGLVALLEEASAAAPAEGFPNTGIGRIVDAYRAGRELVASVQGLEGDGLLDALAAGLGLEGDGAARARALVGALTAPAPGEEGGTDAVSLARPAALLRGPQAFSHLPAKIAENSCICGDKGIQSIVEIPAQDNAGSAAPDLSAQRDRRNHEQGILSKQPGKALRPDEGKRPAGAVLRHRGAQDKRRVLPVLHQPQLSLPHGSRPEGARADRPKGRRGPGDGEGLYPAAGLAGRALERRAHQGGGSRGALRHRGRRLHGQL